MIQIEHFIRRIAHRISEKDLTNILSRSSYATVD